MKLIELFESIVLRENLNLDAYGWWLDDAGEFHEVKFHGHSDYLRPNEELINDNRFFEIYDAAFDRGWIRITSDHGDDKSPITRSILRIEGKRSAIQRHLQKIVKLLKDYDVVYIDILEEVPEEVMIHYESSLKYNTEDSTSLQIPSELPKFISFIKKTVSEDIQQRNDYGAWIDTNNHKLYNVTDHEEFFDENIAPTLKQFGEEELFRNAYKYGWVRVVWPSSKSVSTQLSIKGTQSGLRAAWTTISKYIKIRDIDVVGIDMVDVNRSEKSKYGLFYLKKPGQLDEFYKMIGFRNQ